MKHVGTITKMETINSCVQMMTVDDTMQFQVVANERTSHTVNDGIEITCSESLAVEPDECIDMNGIVVFKDDARIFLSCGGLLSTFPLDAPVGTPLKLRLKRLDRKKRKRAVPQE